VARQVARDRHVLSVAEQLFLEKGYHQVSLALVASSAGVATRTIYARFGEKRALLEEIIECRRDASEMALSTLGGEHLASGGALYRIALHAFEHELLPGLELLHADLLADRETHAPVPRRWAEEGRWRLLLERSLAPAPSCVADVFVACLMREQHRMRNTSLGKKLSAEAVDGMARKVVECFREQIKALNAHIDALTPA
jgi:AcrR family transcriptional regulator